VVYVYRNHPFCIPPKKTVTFTVPAARVASEFSLRRSWLMPFHRLSFYLQFSVMDPCFIPSDSPWQKSFHHQPSSGRRNLNTHLSLLKVTPFHTLLL